jgi:hypothetical protein
MNMGWLKVRSAIISLAATVAAFVTLSACTPERESPLEFGARATVRAATPTPTPRPDQPTPTPVPAEEMERVARERSDAYLEALYEPTEGTVRMGIWDDKRVQLDSHLAGYVIVYGYDYAVEMVETTAEEYPGLLETGELDIVLQTSPDLSDWLAERLKDGAVLDVGTMVEATPGTRIVVHGRLTERAPQIVDFLKSITADDEVFDSAAARITGGRLGINPNVAALTVLKNHEDLWTQWAPAEVVERVKSAIAAGKSDLKNRKCVPTGGGGTTPNCRGWTGGG